MVDRLFWGVLSVSTLLALGACDAETDTSGGQDDSTGRNAAPKVKDLAFSTNEDEPIDITLEGSDPDGDPMSWVLTALPANGTLSGNAPQLTYTPDPDFNGADAIGFRAEDGTAQSEEGVVDITIVPVNDPPRISGSPAQSVPPDVQYSFTPEAEDVDADETLSFSIENQPEWATFDTVTGQLSGTPGDANDGKTFTGIVISVRDSSDASDALPPFEISVDNVNDPPVLSGSPATSVAEDESYTFEPTMEDPDFGDTHTFSVKNRPDWASFDGTTGTLSGTPTNADVGTYGGIEISVEDAGGLGDTLPAFSITVENVNDPPELTGTPDTTVREDTEYAFAPQASDPDANANLTFSIENRPDWLAFTEATGAVTGTPTQEDVGPYSDITIKVDDGELSDSIVWTLTVENVNDPPGISGTPLGEIGYGETYSFTPDVEDPDLRLGNETLSYAISNKPSWAEFDTASGELSGTPTIHDIELYENIEITVTDAAGESATLGPFSITVIDLTPPVGVTDLAATPYSQEIALRWTNPTDADFAGVRICWNTIDEQADVPPSDPEACSDSLDVPQSEASTTLADLTNGTEYGISVWAYDAATPPNFAARASLSATPQDPGTLDASWAQSGEARSALARNEQVHAVAGDEQGRVLVVGAIHDATNSHDDMAVWRFTADGEVDTSFGGDNDMTDGPDGYFQHDRAGGDDVGYDLALDGQDRIYVCGESDAAGGSEMVLWRLTADGTLDTSFGNGGVITHDNAAGGDGRDAGRGIALDGDDTVYVAGHSDATGDKPQIAVWKYTNDTNGQSDWSLDDGFGSSGVYVPQPPLGGGTEEAAYDIVVDDSGRLVVSAGAPDGNDTAAPLMVFRLDSNGGLDDEDFGSSGVFSVDAVEANGTMDVFGRANALALDIDPETDAERILVVGRLLEATGTTDEWSEHVYVTRLTADGQVETGFGEKHPAPPSQPWTENTDYCINGTDVAVDSRGHVVAAGYRCGESGSYHLSVWRWTASGEPPDPGASSLYTSVAEPEQRANANAALAMGPKDKVILGGIADDGADAVDDLVLLRLSP